MNDDKRLFQETAQKLIDYDNANRNEFQDGQNEVWYGSKKFYAYRVVLVIYVLTQVVVFFLPGWTFGILDHVFFITLFIISFKQYKKKIAKTKRVLNKRKELLNHPDRTEWVKVLSALSQRNPEWGTEPWWITANGMEFGRGRFKYTRMVYYMLPLVVENEVGEKVVQGKENYNVNDVTGKEVNETIQFGNCKRFNITPTVYLDAKEYNMAGIYLYSTSPMYASEYVKASNADEVRREMEYYRKTLDEKERKKNYWNETGFHYETNAEKYERRNWMEPSEYDWHEQMNDEFSRQLKEEEKQRSLANEMEEIRYISGYEHELYLVGYFIWNGDNISDILICKDYMTYFGYQTKEEEFAYIYSEYDRNFKNNLVPIPTLSVISKLSGFQIGSMDYTGRRPQEIEPKEWAAWVYAHTSE